MIELDRLSRRILRELERDARQTNVKLAERVGLSPSACLRRVQELERSGVIKGYRAVVDRTLVGLGFVVYVAVGMSCHTREVLDAFEKAISVSADVVECHTVTGAVEYLLRVEVADMQAYRAFHTQVLGVLPHVHSVVSYIVMDTAKDERA
ncbi:Lrp/AsnC family transcriptional regulator [Pseudomonas oryzihabitans]|uniref:Lrp/AsnC family transcriptional regulator n=1 Tax=Pseudomonas oryzihabitans TaxID=47885 RepID=UPI00111ED609|nr:winged helix-turn-helix transcriptional regulator [Pseudomonas psychrotolerans]QDD88169.1 AsnC family transcriptional regulator [Pseudomonas psychrotolerans]